MHTHSGFLTSAWDDAMRLLVEARNYIAFRQMQELGREEEMRLRISCESMRVTARLSQVTAWLLTRRAVDEGELTPEQALNAEWRLGGQEVCLQTAANDGDELPEGLRSLSERSLRLYERIQRLEHMLGGEGGPRLDEGLRAHAIPAPEHDAGEDEGGNCFEGEERRERPRRPGPLTRLEALAEGTDGQDNPFRWLRNVAGTGLVVIDGGFAMPQGNATG